MAKSRAKFICERCGAESAQWHGKCPSCGEWNTLASFTPPTALLAAAPRAPSQPPVPLAEVDLAAVERRQTGVAELDRVLGGGLVPGALMLVAGDPGIGKSTLLLQAASAFAQGGGSCLYVSGEESLGQVAMRSQRLAARPENVLLLAETDLSVIEEQVQRTSPDLLIVDSIQAMYSPDTQSLPGTVSQVRSCAARLLRIAKDLRLPTFLVGHVTKDGSVAGPRLLEHMVDTVLSLEGECHSGYRVLRSLKNRFGSTDELGLFQMTEAGLEGVPDPSAALLAERRNGTPGSSVVAAIEGTRPLLLEVQALVARAAPYGSPRRSVTGVDLPRTCLILAVLEKQAGISLAGEDVFVNIPGGIRTAEPAVDLGIALAVASSAKDAPIRPDTACVGEVGLTGEVRSVPMVDRRLAELRRHGFRRCLVPPRAMSARHGGIEAVPVEDLRRAFVEALSG